MKLLSCQAVIQLSCYLNIVLSYIGTIGGMKLRCKLPELMRPRNLDQKTVAAETGLSPTTVGKLYRSHFDRIDNHTVTLLCKYFGIKRLDDLLEIVWEEDDIEGIQV
jgi:DNA-binding Xre family transcriptional regulator